MIRTLAALLLLMLAAPALAQDVSLAELRVQDARLAAVADRIMAANAGLCSQTMPITGLALHSFDQYDASTRPQLFPDGPLMVALVVPGSPAEAAGLREGDVVRAIGGEAIGDPAGADADDRQFREQAFDLLASQPPGQPISMRVERARSAMELAITAPPGCRALVEVLADGGIMGRSNGQIIQLSYPLAAMLDDAGLAVIFAHELAHSVLHHRARLEAAGVDKGLLREFGRNGRLNRLVEVEADLLSAHLLANAGYDPAIAPAFWRSPAGYRAGGGGLRSSLYRAPDDRAAMIAAEIAQYLPAGAHFSDAAHLIALRDAPFAGEE